MEFCNGSKSGGGSTGQLINGITHSKTFPVLQDAQNWSDYMRVSNNSHINLLYHPENLIKYTVL